MYAGGRAPKANAEEIAKSRTEFRTAMDEFGVEDLDEKLPRRNKRKFKSAYFDNRSGGFYVMQKGHEYQEDEIIIARRLLYTVIKYGCNPKVIIAVELV